MEDKSSVGPNRHHLKGNLVVARICKIDELDYEALTDQTRCRPDALYAIERETKAMTDAQRKSVRQEKALPLLQSLHVWGRLEAANAGLRQTRRCIAVPAQSMAETHPLCR